MTTDPRHHTIDYHELTATDLAASKRFYGTAFGWSFNDYGPEYAGIKGPGADADAGGEIGGFNATGERAAPLMVLYSEDLDASNRAVREAGGEIVRDTFAFPGGRRFHFADPAGNVLAVWSDR